MNPNFIEMRNQLAKHIKGGEAFQPIEYFLDEVPFDKVGIRPDTLPYSFYEVVYHIVFAQKDILDFMVADNYEAPKWPDEYWPKKQKPENEKEWSKLISDYTSNRQQLIDFVQNKENDLSKPVKNDEKQTLLREVLLVLEHTAYHTGQLAVLSRLLNVHTEGK